MHYFDKHGWYTSTALEGREADVAPENFSETTTPGELRANWTGYKWMELPYSPPLLDEPYLPPAPPPPVITRAQGKAALITAGLWNDVLAYVAAIPDATQKALAEVALHDTQTWQRSSPFLAAAAQALGLSDEQLDELFATAALIEL